MKSAGAKHTQKTDSIQCHRVPTLMYGSEMWLLNKQQERAVEATEMKVLRRIVEKRRMDRKRNVKITKELKQEVVL